MIKKFLWIFVVVMAGIGCESQKKAEGNINSLQVCVSEAISSFKLFNIFATSIGSYFSVSGFLGP